MKTIINFCSQKVNLNLNQIYIREKENSDILKDNLTANSSQNLEKCFISSESENDNENE